MMHALSLFIDLPVFYIFMRFLVFHLHGHDPRPILANLST